jgi:hypothetical protein
MKCFIDVKIFILLLLFNCSFAICQDVKPATPIQPGERIHALKIGVFGGLNLPVKPSELVSKPTVATMEVQQSLLNGLDGLGYGPTVNLGVVAKYPLSDKFYLGANIEYSGWKSTNSCNCNDIVGKSVNSLTMLNFGVFSQYVLFYNFYIAPEISFNLLNAKVTENSSRGNLDFSKSYPRIGMGLGVGCELPLTNKFALDVSAKGRFPNLLLGKENNGNSESLINSKNETKEALLFILTFNIGLLYSL